MIGRVENPDLGQRLIGRIVILAEGHARLGGYHLGQDALRQEILVQPDTALVYDVRVKAGAADADDRMVLRLTDENGDQLSVPRTHAGDDAPGWRRMRVDLSPFAGRKIFLSFDAKTDGERLTTFYLDDLTLRR